MDPDAGCSKAAKLARSSQPYTKENAEYSGVSRPYTTPSGAIFQPVPTLLHVAAQVGDLSVVLELIAGGAPVNAVAPGGWTPLLLACASAGSTEVVRVLLERGADQEAALTPGHTPLIVASRAGVVATVAMLLLGHPALGGPPNQDERNRVNTARKTLGVEQLGTCTPRRQRANTEARTKQGYTALMFAAESGHVGVVSLLLVHGANRDSKNAAGRTARDLASHDLGDGVLAGLAPPSAPASPTSPTGTNAGASRLLRAAHALGDSASSDNDSQSAASDSAEVEERDSDVVVPRVVRAPKPPPPTIALTSTSAPVAAPAAAPAAVHQTQPVAPRLANSHRPQPLALHAGNAHQMPPLAPRPGHPGNSYQLQPVAAHPGSAYQTQPVVTYPCNPYQPLAPHPGAYQALAVLTGNAHQMPPLAPRPGYPGNSYQLQPVAAHPGSAYQMQPVVTYPYNPYQPLAHPGAYQALAVRTGNAHQTQPVVTYPCNPYQPLAPHLGAYQAHALAALPGKAYQTGVWHMPTTVAPVQKRKADGAPVAGEGESQQRRKPNLGVPQVVMEAAAAVVKAKPRAGTRAQSDNNSRVNPLVGGPGSGTGKGSPRYSKDRFTQLGDDEFNRCTRVSTTTTDHHPPPTIHHHSPRSLPHSYVW